MAEDVFVIIYLSVVFLAIFISNKVYKGPPKKEAPSYRYFFISYTFLEEEKFHFGNSYIKIKGSSMASDFKMRQYLQDNHGINNPIIMNLQEFTNEDYLSLTEDSDKTPDHRVEINLEF